LRGEEKRVGGLLLAVPVGVFVWKVSFFYPVSFLPVPSRTVEVET
jgi:hypothetical protein